MKKQSKKLISLLAVSCLATAAVAGLAACGGETTPTVNAGMTARDVYELYAKAESNPLTYEEWLETIKGPAGPAGPQGPQGEQGIQGPSGETHTHNFGDTVVEIIPATGMKDGIGVKICADDNEMQFVVLPKLAGVIAANPIDVPVGETKTVTVNTYDSDRYGVSVDSGEKNVMYFTTTAATSGAIAVYANVPNVKYEYYTTDAFSEDDKAYSRYVDTVVTDYSTWPWTESDEPKTVYVKMTFPEGTSATVEVSSQLTLLSDLEAKENKVENTIKLPEGVAAQDVKVYAWGISGYEEVYNPETDSYETDYSRPIPGWNSWNVDLFEDGREDPWEEGVFLAGDYVPFKGTNTATVWLSPIEYTKYKVEVVGLDENYAIIDEVVLEFPENGANDAGATVEISVVPQHKFTFTVQNANGVMADVNVEIQDLYGEAITSATSDAEGKVEFFLPEDEEGYFEYAVTLTDLPFGYSPFTAVELSTETKEVTLTAQSANVIAMTADGTQYGVMNGAKSWATVTVAEGDEGEYVFTLSDSSGDDSYSYGTYNFSVNGQYYGRSRNPWDLPAISADMDGNVVQRVALKVGVNEITIDAVGGRYASETMQLNVVKYVPPVSYDLELNVAKTVSEGKTYTFTASSAGTYKFAVSAGEGQKCSWASFWASEDVYYDYQNGAPFWAAQESSKAYEKEMAVGDKVTIFVDNASEGDFIITVTKNTNPELIFTADVAKEVTAGTVYEFTAPAAGAYLVSPNGANAAGVSCYFAANYTAGGDAFAVGGASGIIYLTEGQIVKLVFTNTAEGAFNVVISAL